MNATSLIQTLLYRQAKLDGIHLDEEQHLVLGKAIADYVSEIL